MIGYIVALMLFIFGLFTKLLLMVRLANSLSLLKLIPVYVLLNGILTTVFCLLPTPIILV